MDMEKLVGQKGPLDVARRMAPMKVTVGLLYRELDTAKNEHSVTIDRALFESVISTLELVVEDIEARYRGEANGKPVERANDRQPQPQRA